MPEDVNAPSAAENPGMRERAEFSKEVNKGIEKQMRDRCRQMEQNPTAEYQRQALDSWCRIRAAGRCARSLLKFPEEIPADRDPRTSKQYRVGEIENTLADLGELTKERDDNDPNIVINNYEQKPNPRLAGRYLLMRPTRDSKTGKELKGNNMTFYSVRVDTVQKDIADLQNAILAFPEYKEQLQSRINALQKLLCADPVNYAQEQIQQAKRNSPANKMFGFMGRTGAILVLGGATLMTGVMSLASGNLSSAPFLYGGLLLYAINPKFFAGKNERQIREAATLLNDPEFVQRIAPKYGMKGQKWSGALQQMIEMERKNESPLKKFDRREITAQELAEAFFPDKKTAEYVNMLKFINCKPDFDFLRSKLRDIRDPEVKRTLAAYVEQGAWEYAGPRRKIPNPAVKPEEAKSA